MATSALHPEHHDDPLAAMLRPPPGETPAERAERLAAEAQAKKISDQIDDMLKQEAKQRKARAKKEVKVLLLGQSESGKSTCLKQFQLLYSPSSFAAERASWTAVIYLNLAKSIRQILDALSTEEPDIDTATIGEGEEETARTSTSKEYSRFAAIKLKLSPLALAEELLIRSLGDGDEEATQLGSWHTERNRRIGSRVKEVFVRSGVNWKRKGKEIEPTPTGGSQSSSSGGSHTSRRENDPFAIIAACRDDMIALWTDPEVRKILDRKQVRLQDSSGFYLDDIRRITTKGYIPSNQDVLNARLKTIGVIEHLFTVDGGVGDRNVDWRIFDVGGHRDQRQMWASYFDDVNAIIFLAPVGAFDQVLAEDPSVLRIEDTLLLFRAVCRNKLLAGVNIVLFLNKIDILKKKLEAGVRLNQYLKGFADRQNDMETVTKYFKSKFAAIHRDNSPIKTRDIFTHLTTVTDIQTTTAIIADVRETILRKHLQQSSLL